MVGRLIFNGSNMKVYLLEEITCEGSEMLGAYAHESDAVVAALKTPNGGRPWKLLSKNFWDGGWSIYIKVSEMEVQG